MHARSQEGCNRLSLPQMFVSIESKQVGAFNGILGKNVPYFELKGPFSSETVHFLEIGPKIHTPK